MGQGSWFQFHVVFCWGRKGAPHGMVGKVGGEQMLSRFVVFDSPDSRIRKNS